MLLLHIQIISHFCELFYLEKNTNNVFPILQGLFFNNLIISFFRLLLRQIFDRYFWSATIFVNLVFIEIKKSKFLITISSISLWMLALKKILPVNNKKICWGRLAQRKNVCSVKLFSERTQVWIPLPAKGRHEFFAREFNLHQARPRFIKICHWNLELNKAPSIRDEL